MKKKLIALCLIVVLAAVAVVGGSLAYFTDKDQETNVFTTGKIDIDLIEQFPENKLMPGLDVQKEITVKNEGTEDTYVRIHFAVPAILDSGSEDLPQFAAYNNTLHWNFSSESLEDGKWNWNADKDGANYPGNGGNWNMYQTTVAHEIDGKTYNVVYNVYVATFETALEPTEVTAPPAVNKVYLDTSVTQEQMDTILAELGEIRVLVFAEGGQTATFNDAYTALNTQFGDPMAADYVSPWNQK